ncbi:hypothetical protein H5T52_11475 [Candidatus Bipolaricaulota bacterium]|nr:hypothetical protein [Candidatus Bipolaricaulota bacterium]
MTVTLNIGWKVYFPVTVEVEADCMHQVKECDETNKAASFSVGRANTCK